MHNYKTFSATLVLLFVFAVDAQPDELPSKLRRFIRAEEEFVREIAATATELHQRRVELVRNCNCSKHACSNDFLDAQCVTHLGTPDMCEKEGRRVDTEGTIFKTPPGTNPDDLSNTLKENICVYKGIADGVSSSDAEFGWTYVGTRDGHFRRFPATASPRGVEDGDELLNNCEKFDPRVRPWFISASTGPKDLVIVVDKSGSMNDFVGVNRQSKWDLTERAVLDILDTFTFADFINVVTFSDTATPLWTESGLVRGEQSSLAVLKQVVENEYPAGKTNFTAAFETAFQLLTENCNDEPKSCSNCHKIILFLTDGKDTSEEDGKSIKPSKMVDLIDDWQKTLAKSTGRRASIFTYSMSELADDSIPRQIACANDGAWSFIGPNTNALDALNSYYLFVAAGRKTDKPIWLEPYEDASGLGMLTTVAMPFYAVGNAVVEDVFLGVVGHDVGFHELQIGGVTRDEALNAIIDRSERCSISEDTSCELQAYRNSQDERSLCPDSYPFVRSPSLQSGAELFSVDCYELEGMYYKKVFEEVSWTSAVRMCEDDGGVLISIADRDELAFVANLASPDGSWIGAEKRSSSSTFSWLDENLEGLKEDSDFWGVQEPFYSTGSEDCAAIDTRGVIGNLHARPCDELLTFICKYKNDKSCTAGVGKAPNSGFFVIPPMKRCLDAAEVLDQTRPIKDSKNLKSKEVMCPLGGRDRTSEEVICCPDSGV